MPINIKDKTAIQIKIWYLLLNCFFTTSAIQRLSSQVSNLGMGTVLIGDMGMPAGVMNKHFVVASAIRHLAMLLTNGYATIFSSRPQKRLPVKA